MEAQQPEPEPQPQPSAPTHSKALRISPEQPSGGLRASQVSPSIGGSSGDIDSIRRNIEAEEDPGYLQQAAGAVGSGLLGVAQGAGGVVYDATVGQLPTAQEAGQAVGGGLATAVGAVGSEALRVGGLAGGAALEAIVGGGEDEPRTRADRLPSPPTRSSTPPREETENPLAGAQVETASSRLERLLAEPASGPVGGSPLVARGLRSSTPPGRRP